MAPYPRAASPRRKARRSTPRRSDPIVHEFIDPAMQKYGLLGSWPRDGFTRINHQRVLGTKTKMDSTLESGFF